MELTPLQSAGGHHYQVLQQQPQPYQIQPQPPPPQQQQVPSVTPRHQVVVAQLQQLQMQQKQEYYNNAQQPQLKQDYYGQLQQQQLRRRQASRDSSRWSLLEDENVVDLEDPGDQVCLLNDNLRLWALKS